MRKKTEIKPWWNRPLVGSVSIFERLLGALNPQDVPELALSLHETELEELTRLAPTLTMLDNEQYSKEFLFYLTVKNKIEQNLDEYKGLQKFIKIFSFAIKNINHFRNVRRIELDFQTKSLLELYDFVDEQLQTSYDTHLFRKLLHKEIHNLLNTMQNEPTQQAINLYKTSLDAITEEAIGLNLLILFKKYKIADYSIFTVVTDIVKQIKKQDLTNLKALVLIVKFNYDEIHKLTQIIGISTEEDPIITYAKILQYIALNSRYENILYRFQQLLDNLKKWHKHYQTVIEIRQEYPLHKYKVPSNFTQAIAGESIFFKYQNFMDLTLH